MSRPLISCIAPVFNGERYLREAIESIFAQTYRPLAVLVHILKASPDRRRLNGCAPRPLNFPPVNRREKI